jgi:hypothetical protein
VGSTTSQADNRDTLYLGKFNTRAPKVSDTNPDTKRILLIDEDDDRRMTRVTLLQHAGYFVEVRRDIKAAQGLEDEGTFDLVIVALRLDPKRTTAYSNELASHYPGLPILLLTDHGVFAPAGTLGTTLEAGHPIELMSRLASMLAGSSYVRLIK